jgi:hypothetical protein
MAGDAPWGREVLEQWGVDIDVRVRNVREAFIERALIESRVSLHAFDVVRSLLQGRFQRGAMALEVNESR